MCSTSVCLLVRRQKPCNHRHNLTNYMLRRVALYSILFLRIFIQLKLENHLQAELSQKQFSSINSLIFHLKIRLINLCFKLLYSLFPYISIFHIPSLEYQESTMNELFIRSHFSISQW